MATYDSFKGHVLSLDIETTGIDPGGLFGPSMDGIEKKTITPRIWSTAFHNTETDKTYETIYRSLNREAERDALSSNEFYGKNKVWADYIGADHNTFSSQTVSEGLNSDFRKSGVAGGMLLIQNSQFENKWITHQSKVDTNFGIDILRNQRYKTVDELGEKPGLYRPSIISQLRNQIYDADRSSVAAIDSLYDSMIKAYSEETTEAAKNGKLIVGDLMDFTGATYSKAVKEGWLDPVYMTKGRGVEFMASMFLGEKETHAAGSDARQQSLLFKKMLGLRDRISSGEVTEADRVTFRKMNLAARDLLEETSAKGAISFIESLKSGTINTYSGIGGIHPVRIMDSVTNTSHTMYVPQRGLEVKRNEILMNFLANTSTNSDTEAYRMLEKAMEYGDQSLDYIKSDDFVGRLNEISSSSSSRIEGIINDSSVSPQNKNSIPRLKESIDRVKKGFSSQYKDGLESAPEIIKAIMPTDAKRGAMVGGALSLIGGLWAISQTNDSEKAIEYQNRRRQRNMDTSIDSTINMYNPVNKPELPYGYARAQWESRIGHHEYG